jgi:hypothetical protein
MRRAITLSLAVVVGGCHSLFGYSAPGDRGAADRPGAAADGQDRGPGQDGPGRDGPRRDGQPLSCSDGTPVGGCSATKLHCDTNRALVVNCSACGCPFGSCGGGKCSKSLLPTADSFIHIKDGLDATRNFGTEPSLHLVLYSTEQAHSYLDFAQLLQLPRTAVFDSAMLTLKPTGWGGRPVDANLQLIADPWTETSITFSNKPALAGTKYPRTLSYSSTPITVDVTALVNDWVKLPTTAHGLCMWTISTARALPPNCKSDAGGCGYSVSYASRDTEVAADKPSLAVVYH